MSAHLRTPVTAAPHMTVQRFCLYIRARHGLHAHIEEWIRTVMHGSALRLCIHYPDPRSRASLVICIDAPRGHRREITELVRQLTCHPAVRSLRWEVISPFLPSAPAATKPASPIPGNAHSSRRKST